MALVYQVNPLFSVMCAYLELRKQVCSTQCSEVSHYKKAVLTTKQATTFLQVDHFGKVFARRQSTILFRPLFGQWTADLTMTRLKAESHCSDNKNDNDHDAKRTLSIGWIAPCRIRTCSFNQWNAFSLRCYRYRSRNRCSGTGPLWILYGYFSTLN